MHEDLAQMEGVPVFTVRLIFMMLIAVVIALVMKTTRNIGLKNGSIIPT